MIKVFFLIFAINCAQAAYIDLKEASLIDDSAGAKHLSFSKLFIDWQGLAIMPSSPAILFPHFDDGYLQITFPGPLNIGVRDQYPWKDFFENNFTFENLSVDNNATEAKVLIDYLNYDQIKVRKASLFCSPYELIKNLGHALYACSNQGSIKVDHLTVDGDLFEEINFHAQQQKFNASVKANFGINVKAKINGEVWTNLDKNLFYIKISKAQAGLINIRPMLLTEIKKLESDSIKLEDDLLIINYE